LKVLKKTYEMKKTLKENFFCSKKSEEFTKNWKKFQIKKKKKIFLNLVLFKKKSKKVFSKKH